MAILLCILLSLLAPTIRPGDPSHVQAGLAVMQRLQSQLAAVHGHPIVAIHTSMMDRIEGGGFGLQVLKPHTLEEAQALAIEYVEIMMQAFNEDEQARPFLANSPFTAKNVSVNLVFQHEDGKDVAYPYPSVLFLCKGRFYGWYLEPENMEERCEIPSEQYEEVKLRLQTARTSTAAGALPA
jgi:hypothetical protein